MTAKDVQTSIHKAVRTVAQLPPETPVERVAKMIGRTLLGLLFVAIGVVGLVMLEMNHYLAVGLVLVGATTWSSQLVTGTLKSLIGPFRAFRDAAKGD